MASRILVVEDERAALMGLVELRRTAGYDVEGAASFEEGRRALAERPPDLLVADIRLKAFNGLHLVILGRQASPEMPAIAMSAYEDATLATEAQRQGASFMLKPFDAADMLALVADLLGQHATATARRWPRKAIPGGIAAMVADRPVTIVDASYGGFRLERSQRHGELPAYFDVIEPALALSIRARSVWSLRQPSGAFHCGAAVADGQPDTEREWRVAVDRLGTMAT